MVVIMIRDYAILSLGFNEVVFETTANTGSHFISLSMPKLSGLVRYVITSLGVSLKITFIKMDYQNYCLLILVSLLGFV